MTDKELRIVPLVIYPSAEVGRVEIGIAEVFPDGTVRAHYTDPDVAKVLGEEAHIQKHYSIGVDLESNDPTEVAFRRRDDVH